MALAICVESSGKIRGSIVESLLDSLGEGVGILHKGMLIRVKDFKKVETSDMNIVGIRPTDMEPACLLKMPLDVPAHGL